MKNFLGRRTKTKWGKYTIGSGEKLYLGKAKAQTDYFFVMLMVLLMSLKGEWLKSGGKFILLIHI